MNLKIKRQTGILVSGVGMIASILYIINLCNLSGQMPNMAGILFVWASALGIVGVTGKKCESKVELVVIYAAFFLHILILLIDIYGKCYVTIVHSGADSESFYRISEQYYYGDFAEYSTWYPYILNGFYQITGLSRLAVQYVNVLFWIFSMMIMQNVCRLLNIKGNYRICALVLLGFLPNYLFLTSILLRESMISFFLFCSFYYLLKWMKLGKLRYMVAAFLVPVPAIILHSGSIAVWAAYGIVFAFYDYEIEKFHLMKKSIWIFCLGIGGITLCFFNQTTRALLLAYIPQRQASILEYANHILSIKRTSLGGSDYLADVEITGYMSLFLCTLQRTYYFLFAPMPSDWRGINDIMAFFMNSFFYLIAIYTALSKKILYRKPLSPYTIAMLLTILCTAGLFAWGVHNAGTAMRHRDKIIGIAVVLFVYCLGYKAKSHEGGRLKGE